MDRIILFLFFALFSTSVLAESSFLLTTPEADPHDSIVLADMMDFLTMRGLTFQLMSESEVREKDLKENIGLHVERSQVIIVRSLIYQDQADDLSAYIQAKYHIVPIILRAQDMNHPLFEDFDTKPRSIYEIHNSKQTLIVRMETDLRAAQVLTTALYENTIGRLPHEINPRYLTDRDVIILGGPCTNPFWYHYADDTCHDWVQENPRGAIRIIQNPYHPEYTITLIAGNSREQTLFLSKHYIETRMPAVNEQLFGHLDDVYFPQTTRWW